MAVITKKETLLKLEFIANSDHTIHAGLVVIEAMARRFCLWDKLRARVCLDPRKDKKRGYSPEVIVGQIIYALCSGGGCLSDSEALNDDPLARELFGVATFADQSQVGEWLRGQSDHSVTALREVFFDGTQLEVNGKHFEGAKLNYNRDMALSWQTLWVGPLLTGCQMGSPGDVSDQLLPMMERDRSLWKGHAAHFYAESGAVRASILMRWRLKDGTTP